MAGNRKGPLNFFKGLFYRHNCRSIVIVSIILAGKTAIQGSGSG